MLIPQKSVHLWMNFFGMTMVIDNSLFITPEVLNESVEQGLDKLEIMVSLNKNGKNNGKNKTSTNGTSKEVINQRSTIFK